MAGMHTYNRIRPCEAAEPNEDGYRACRRQSVGILLVFCRLSLIQGVMCPFST